MPGGVDTLPHFSSLVLDTASMYLDASLDHWQRQQQKAIDASCLQSQVTHILNQGRQQETQSGDDTLAQIQYLLSDGFGVKRSEIQCEIHNEFVIATLPKIYQDSWTFNAARIKRQFRVKEVIQEVLVVMPRRRGKTYSTAMYAAACLLAIPSCSCIIFSTGERTARLLMEVIRNMFEAAFNNGALNRDDYRIETDNKECLEFYGPDGTKRTLMCLPGSVRVSLHENNNTPHRFFVSLRKQTCKKAVIYCANACVAQWCANFLNSFFIIWRTIALRAKLFFQNQS